MDRKKGFFAAIKDEVSRGRRRRRRSRSESPSRAPTPLAGTLPFRRLPPAPEASMSGGVPLPPLTEGPDAGGGEGGGGRREWWGHWWKGRISRNPSDVRLLLGVMAAPLGPVGVGVVDGFRRLSVKDSPKETSAAQYILEQYTSVTGGSKLLRSIRNSYAVGKVRMVALELETANKFVRNSHASRDTKCGAFVLWQMSPSMWYVELAVGGTKVSAGCNGELIWHHSSWLGVHLDEGPVRPLRRALQGLDPLTTAAVFANAQYVGEKVVNGEECYVLKLCADPETLKARSEAPVQVTRHVLFGYFSMRTGFLIHMVDSCMTRVVASDFSDAVYWETTISSFLNDYRSVDGIMIAHSGRSVFTLYTFGDEAMSLTKMRMEESWTIEEVAFNVHGLSVDLFIPPADLCPGEKGRTR